MNLLAFENLAQLLEIQPDAGGSLSHVLPEQRPEVGQLPKVQLAGALEHSPAHSFEFRGGFPFSKEAGFDTKEA